MDVVYFDVERSATQLALLSHETVDDFTPLAPNGFDVITDVDPLVPAQGDSSEMGFQRWLVRPSVNYDLQDAIRALFGLKVCSIPAVDFSSARFEFLRQRSSQRGFHDPLKLAEAMEVVGQAIRVLLWNCEHRCSF